MSNPYRPVLLDDEDKATIIDTLESAIQNCWDGMTDEESMGHQVINNTVLTRAIAGYQKALDAVRKA